MNSQDQLNEIFKKAMGGQQEKSRIIMPGQEQEQEANPMMEIIMRLMQIEQSLGRLSRNNMMFGASIDICQMTFHFLSDLLIEKGIVEEEEYKERYKRDVIDKYEKMREEMKKEAKKIMDEQIKEHEDSLKEQDEVAEKVTKEAEDNVVSIKK